jgi:hypothetical protein
MNFNFFKHKEEAKNENPAEEIKNTTEVEASQEEEMSAERINELKECDKEIAALATIEEADIEKALQNPETAEALGKKVVTLNKVAETLKDYAPAILGGVAALAGIAALSDLHVTDAMWDSGGYAAEKMEYFATMFPTVVATLFSIITAATAKEIKEIWRGNKEESSANESSEIAA